MFKNRDLKGVHITRFICLCVILTKLCQSLKSFEMKSLYTLERCHNEHVLTSIIECKQISIYNNPEFVIEEDGGNTRRR